MNREYDFRGITTLDVMAKYDQSSAVEDLQDEGRRIDADAGRDDRRGGGDAEAASERAEREEVAQADEPRGEGGEEQEGPGEAAGEVWSEERIRGEDCEEVREARRQRLRGLGATEEEIRETWGEARREVVQEKQERPAAEEICAQREAREGGEVLRDSMGHGSVPEEVRPRVQGQEPRVVSARTGGKAPEVSYADFVASKMAHVVPTGLAVVPALHHLFPFQADLVAWALRLGRAAIFADTGLGKTRMQLEWARCVHEATGCAVLILAPLAVAAQTAREGAAIGVSVKVVREDHEVQGPGIYITNYDRLHKFDPSAFGAIVLDESSIIKHHDAKTFSALTDAFGSVPFKLCATATPSPNDYTELGTHAEFLGLCTRAEMLAEFFCHDGGETQKWRLKGHARTAFWRWVASWGALLRRPSDLGYGDDGYVLPGLNVSHHILDADAETVKSSGFLFAQEATDLMDRRRARRASLSARVTKCAEMVNDDRQPWVVWCDLNDESDMLAKAIPDAIEIRGSLDADEKERRIVAFGAGDRRVIISKASITGFGLNWQHCARMAFVGVTDSWEAYYQAVRRCYRFGQTRPVDVHIFASEVEGSVVKNLARKESDAKRMADELSAETRDAVTSEVRGLVRTTNFYAPGEITMPAWLTTEVA